MKNKKQFANNEILIFIKYKIFLILLIGSYNNLNYFSLFFNIYSEYNNIEKYLIICESQKLVNKEKFKNNKNPKVSIISPVFNREKYIYRFLRSIQFQKFKDIEIIFIDDCSKDKSIKIIENYKKKDNRIILIKHKKNKGTFISRNVGILNSRGKYIMLPDPDDIISRNIIYICYNILEIYNYEMIRFNLYYGNGKIFFYYIINGLENGPIYQPELSTYLFYGRGTLLQIDFNVSNKFIKREAFIRALNSLNKFYLNIYMTVYEDGLMNYILYRTVKSLYFIKKIGYYYLKRNHNITRPKSNSHIFIIKFLFLYLNTNNFIFKKLRKKNFNKSKKNLKKDFYFYSKILNMCLNCQYINKKNKNILNNIKDILYSN